MKYPEGTTHISNTKISDGKPYKMDRYWCGFDWFDRVWFWCEYQNKWIESCMNKYELKLVKIK